MENLIRSNYSTIFNLAISEDFILKGIGYNDFNHVKPIHFFREQLFYTMHFILDGKGYLKLNGKEFAIDAGQVFFLPPGVSFCYYPDKDLPWKYIWIELKGNKAGEYGDLMGFSIDKPVISPRNKSEIMRIVTDMLDEIAIQKQSAFKVASAFFSVVAEFSNDNDIDELDYNKEIVSRVKRYVLINYKNPDFKINSIPLLLNMSHSYVYKIFKKETGISMSQFLLDTRLKKAGELAKNSNMRVKEICSAVGFYDELHFMKIFKKHFGATVKDYKNKV